MNTGVTALINICFGENNFEYVKFLLESGADPNITLPQGASALTTAIANTSHVSKEERFKIIKLLLEYGANPNQFGATCNCREIQTYNYKLTSIVVAICLNDSKLVEVLIEYGADLMNPVRACQFGTIAGGKDPTF